jgi:hypothetical protein
MNNEQTMNEFIIQIDKIIKNYPMFRHHTAANRELPEDLPQELWTADYLKIDCLKIPALYALKLSVYSTVTIVKAGIILRGKNQL